jgi:hypothetical protein
MHACVDSAVRPAHFLSPPPCSVRHRSIIPHCSGKAKGERQALIGPDMLAENSEISQLTIKRPMDRVRIRPSHPPLPLLPTPLPLLPAHSYPSSPLPPPPLLSCLTIPQGYLVNFDLEREIWTKVFKSVLKVNPRECGLLLSEPIFNFRQVQAATEQVSSRALGSTQERKRRWQRSALLGRRLLIAYPPIPSDCF